MKVGVDSAPVVRGLTAEISQQVPLGRPGDQCVDLPLQAGGQSGGKRAELLRPAVQKDLRALLVDARVRVRTQVPQPVGAVAETVGLALPPGVVARYRSCPTSSASR